MRHVGNCPADCKACLEADAYFSGLKERRRKTMKNIVRSLKVELTGDERRAKGEELARRMEEYDAVEASAKVASKAAKEKLEGIRERSKGLAREVREGAEMRPTDCHEVADYRNNVVHLIRDDTGEMVEERPMRLEERQASLPTIGDAKKKRSEADAGA